MQVCPVAPLLAGYDSLYLSFCGEVKMEIHRRIIDGVSNVRLGDMTFNVNPVRRGIYDFSLDNERLNLSFAARSLPDGTPSVRVQVKSRFLWSKGVEAAYESVLEAVNRLFENGITDELVSRADLCADFFWSPGLAPENINQFLSRARRRKAEYDGHRFSGFVFKSKQVTALLYDKTFEIQTSKKNWFFKLWKIDPGAQVERVEFQIEGKWLRNRFGIRSCEQLIKSTQGLWNYLTDKWLIMREMNANRRSRQRLTPFWELVQSVRFDTYFEATQFEIGPPEPRNFTSQGGLRIMAGVLTRIAIDSGSTSRKTTWEEIKTEFEFMLEQLDKKKPFQADYQ